MSELPQWIEKATQKASWVSENEMRLCKALTIAWDHIEWQAQNIHQAYHTEETCTWHECQRGVCPSNRQAMRRIEELGNDKPDIESAHSIGLGD